MRKFQKAAVVVAMLGSVGFLGAGVSHAGDQPSVKIDNDQSTSCEANDSGVGGLINVSDLQVNANILGVATQSAGNTAQECNAGFGLG
ncbi:hypothetical protein GCM10010415_49210 [Streptomyces atrovirens]|uniref:Secreted protein n=1 Tax=Streptomyces atrovirens TaxID=285556 RepID=A0ABW0E4U7_9ACTN